ncbi:MAG TPA: hypothetical protein VHO25_10935 [Polyangiaceae bacterium]|nr:hypothetical protein [Polyangiaceae bacterium]
MTSNSHKELPNEVVSHGDQTVVEGRLNLIAVIVIAGTQRHCSLRIYHCIS